MAHPAFVGLDLNALLRSLRDVHLGVFAALLHHGFHLRLTHDDARSRLELAMPDHPKPFSSEWMNAPAVSSEPPRRLQRAANRRLVSFFGKFPGERALTIMVVVVLTLGSFWFAGPRGEAHTPVVSNLIARVPDTPQIQFADPKPTAGADISTESFQVTGNEADTAETQVVPELQLQPAPVEEAPTTAGGLLPGNRILAFYGFPGNPEMGMLGEYDMGRLLELLREQAIEYEEADPSTPVLIAFEVIVSVAQKSPQADGSYLLDTPTSVLNEYADFTRENDILLILDAQIGYRTVENDVKGLRPWLAQEHVHLAIDPEFAMEEGQIPGDHIGSVDAIDIQWAQQWLTDLALEEGVSPKVLIVHQFTESMITNKHQVFPMSGVQLVIDADGWGPPDLKTDAYNYVNNVTAVEYAGVKLFYKLDVPLMTAEDIVNLDPSPLFVMYQ